MVIPFIGRLFSLLYIFFAVSACKQGFNPQKSNSTQPIFVLPAGISLKPIEKSSIKPIKEPGMILVSAGPLSLKDEKTGDTAHVFVHTYLLDSTEVTVGQFMEFVQVKHFKTDAEKFGNAGVFDIRDRSWGLVDSAYWLYPKGKLDRQAIMNEPVTQISWYDAVAYCTWRGKRLPNEIEWEHAARNGRNDAFNYSWGNEWSSGDSIYGNVWQGDFPEIFKNLDGYESVAPVGRFKSSPLGFNDLSGNVWEWCENWRFDYGGLANGSYDPATEKVIRGGSFVCAPNYCHGYKISSRSFTTPETSLYHIGCRCAKDIE